MCLYNNILIIYIYTYIHTYIHTYIYIYMLLLGRFAGAIRQAGHAQEVGRSIGARRLPGIWISLLLSLVVVEVLLVVVITLVVVVVLA